jgi:hypothetical protein
MNAAHLQTLVRHAALLAMAMLLLGSGLVRAADSEQSGSVRIEQIQLAWIGSGNLGGGALEFGGRSYKFTIGGLGVGGFGISKMTAVGEVYGLTDIRDFGGSYVQGRYGLTAGTLSTGELWLQNAQGVVLHLKAERVGLALSLSGDAIYIKMDS